MFARCEHTRRIHLPELCSPDFVTVQQSLPMIPLSSSAPVPTILPPFNKKSARRKQASEEKLQNDRRRASHLVDLLLLDIYNRETASNCSGYTTATSWKSQRSLYRISSEDLFKKGLDEVLRLISQLETDVVRTGNVLVRKLKRRDALRRQRDARCDVISDHLRKRVPETVDMRFSIEPAPGDSGFSQWHSAMRMVAQLPGGIPPEFRRKLWLNLADRHLSSRNINWSKVERECFSEWSHPADAELGVQIVKDLHRTGCSLFCGEDGQENQALLKRVLLAYARWNKAVGYCQGFNMLAALILQVTEKCETEALKLMIFLIEGVLPESYFADSLRGLSVDMAVFRELLRAKLPRLSRHLDNLQTAAKDGTTSYEPPLTNVFTMQWFLTLFCNCLPQPTVLRVWDLILLEGNEILLRTALAIWQTLAERILAVRSADEFYCIMGVLTREILEFGIVDANSLVKGIVTIGPLSELPSLREKYLYNINPWGANVSSGLEAEVRNRQLKVYGRERLVLDISALKKQYSKLKQRQRQAHIIFSAAVARQPPATAPVVAMNHLLLGKTALIPAKRIGPPKGTIPPARQPPTTLHWKDAPPRQQSSSSSSSDTELCDDPDDQDDISPIRVSSSPMNGQLHDDNLIQNSQDLMKTDFSDKSDDAKLTSVSDVGDLLDFDSKIEPVDNNQTNLEISDIFDTTATCSTKGNDEFFDFTKYGIHSDSDDEGFDFEKFLETRVHCLKQNSVDEESIASSEESSEQKRTECVRKNSQRALEIIQENSLILHRILQCQNRLTPSPSPPPQELQYPDYNTDAILSFSHELSTDINSEKETASGVSDSTSPQYYYSTVFQTDNADSATGSIKYSSIYENSLTHDKEHEQYKTKYTIDDETVSDYKPTVDNTSADYKFKTDSPDTTEDIYDSFDLKSLNLPQESDTEISNKIIREEENETRPSFTSILDSEYTRNLEEKYENLILKSNRPKYLDVTASFDKTESNNESSSYKYARGTDIRESPKTPVKIDFERKSPNFENCDQKSPGDCTSFVRSPTSGRIYNPFPVNISSRQNKDVPLRLGLYKKS